MQFHHHWLVPGWLHHLHQWIRWGGGQETGVQQQLSLEDSQSSLKWLPSSKAKEERSPVPPRRKQLPGNQHYSGHPPMPIILQSLYSFAEIQNHYVMLLFYQILEPRQFTIPLIPSRLPSWFNGSLAILLFQLTNEHTKQPKKPPPLPSTQSFLSPFPALCRL